ncbi:hypothetical protein RCO48_10155 [Peribacillus frigoritolerans]|nr:hypothetical protein [Peribacillus frigoritolerans]
MKKKHFFKDKGLDVSVIPGEGGGMPLKILFLDKLTLRLQIPALFFFALDKGEKAESDL